MLPEQTETKLQIPEEERRKIIRLMKRVPRRSLLRRVVDGKTGAILSSSESAFHLITLLNTTPETRWRERLIAAIALRYVPIAPQSKSAAALALSRALHNGYTPIPLIAARRAALAAKRTGVTASLSLLIMAVIYFAFPDGGISWLPAVAIFGIAFLLLVVSPVVFFLSHCHDVHANANVERAAVETLEILRLPEGAGALAKAARRKEHLAHETRKALIQLLPTLTEAHYGRLPNNATPELCALLFDKNTSEHLITLTVEAIGKVGDGRAVEPIQKFAQSARTPKLREMVESILPVLTARREQENASSTLLRHSSAPPVDAGQLLRAASASAATPPEQLLRPSSGIQMSAEDAEDAEKKTKEER